jgi:hypothetical protein
MTNLEQDEGRVDVIAALHKTVEVAGRLDLTERILAAYGARR